MKSPLRLFLEGIIGIVIFLISIGILNIVSNSVGNPVLESIVNFLNQNLLFILKISIVLLLGNVFSAFAFPFNIIYPVFNAVGGALWVYLTFEVFKLIDSLVETNLSGMFAPFYEIALILVVSIVLLGGHLNILSSLGKGKPPKKHKQIRKKSKKQTENKILAELRNILDNLREAGHELASTIAKALEPNKKRKKR